MGKVPPLGPCAFWCFLPGALGDADYSPGAEQPGGICVLMIQQALAGCREHAACNCRCGTRLDDTVLAALGGRWTDAQPFKHSGGNSGKGKGWNHTGHSPARALLSAAPCWDSHAAAKHLCQAQTQIPHQQQNIKLQNHLTRNVPIYWGCVSRAPACSFLPAGCPSLSSSGR